MKALIVGGTGAMGQAAARDLIKQEQVTKVVLGDIVTDPGRLHEKLRASEKISVSKIDVNDHDALVKALKDVNVVINCAGPFHKTGVSVSRAAIEAKVNYVDISDEYKTVENLFVPEIQKLAEKAGITILTGMGSDPGTNNLIAKYHASRLDRVDEIALFWVVSIADLEEGATSGAAWDHSLHMNTGTVPQYLDGRLDYVEAGTGEETVKFLEPLGNCPVRYVGHPQPLTMPRYIQGVRTVVIKGAMVPEWVDHLIQEQKETGFLSSEPIEVKGAKVAPYDLTLQLWRNIPQNRDPGPKASGMKVIVKGERDGKQVTYTSDIVGRTAPGTGIAASIAALMLSSGDVTVKGVAAPEGCMDPEKYLAALLGRGARIYQTETITSMLSV
ncbi:MAG: saccharopine dehydrogenase NADP-binding domain-containing protein [Deltaproteobacteria bacterium]|nr:saccharopine dehydrogenase NADP-binding domain-containing protein [Deltaproteobacteria bacterium]